MIIKSILLLLLTFPAFLHSQDLWKGTICGMTKQEVMEAFPEAKKPDSPSTLGTGAEETLGLESVIIDGREYSVHFYFTTNGLDQVSLRLKEKRNHEDLVSIAEKLESDFTSLFGKPTEKTEEDDLLKMLEIHWITPRRYLGVIVMSVGDSDGILNINFQHPRLIKPNKA